MTRSTSARLSAPSVVDFSEAPLMDGHDDWRLGANRAISPSSWRAAKAGATSRQASASPGLVLNTSSSDNTGWSCQAPCRLRGTPKF